MLFNVEWVPKLIEIGEGAGWYAYVTECPLLQVIQLPRFEPLYAKTIEDRQYLNNWPTVRESQRRVPFFTFVASINITPASAY